MNRSEELCRLLEIKPIIAMCRNSRNCDDAVADCLNCEKRDSKVREVYPDLTKPSNFVKLLKIIYKEWGWIEIKGDGVNNNFIEDFINISILDIKTGLENIDKYPSIKIIIDIAQATKWDY